LIACLFHRYFQEDHHTKQPKNKMSCGELHDRILSVGENVSEIDVPTWRWIEPNAVESSETKLFTTSGGYLRKIGPVKRNRWAVRQLAYQGCSYSVSPPRQAVAAPRSSSLTDSIAQVPDNTEHFPY
jgi:hypothetical protein